jgi:hypothetical protein
MWLLKLDSSGEVQWRRTYTWDYAARIFSLEEIPGDGYLLGGWHGGNLGGEDLWVLKLDKSGEIDPSCDFISESPIAQIDTSAEVLDSSAAARTMNNFPTDTSATARETTAEMEELCASYVPKFDADIQPGSCPNPVNFKKRGVIPAAITAFDAGGAALIDPSTVAMVGVNALRCVIADVAGPYEESSDECCDVSQPDENPDLLCHFDARGVAEAICGVFSPPPAPGDTITVWITGQTYDGDFFRVEDCIRVQTFACAGRTKQTYTPSVDDQDLPLGAPKCLAPGLSLHHTQNCELSILLSSTPGRRGEWYNEGRVPVFRPAYKLLEGGEIRSQKRAVSRDHNHQRK